MGIKLLLVAYIFLASNQSDINLLSNRYFDIYYPRGKEKLAEIVSDYSVTEFERISRNLHSEGERRVNISIIDEKELKNKYANCLPEWGIGFAIPEKNLIILKFPISFVYPNRLKFVIGHEIAHILIHRKAKTEFPRWFDEGAAIYLSRDFGFVDEIKLSLAVLTKNIIPLNELKDSFPSSRTKANLAYIESASTIEYLVSDSGPQILPEILKETARFNDFSKGFLMATGGVDLPVFQLEWKNYIKKTFLLTFFLKPNLLFLFVAIFVLFVGISRRWQRKRTSRGQESVED